MELIETKILASVILGLGSVIFGFLPLCLTNSRNQNSLFLSCLLCYGGGVLLSTSLTHMLPENRVKMKGYEQYAEIIFCMGFFLLYIVDEIVHFIYGGAHSHSILSKRCSVKERTNNLSVAYGATENTPIKPQPPYNPAFSRRITSSGYDGGAHQPSHLCNSTHNEEDTPSQLCHVGHQEPCESSAPAINFGLVIALTLHSFLEGLVVGLEGTSTKVLLLLGAISSHKLVVGFCLGLELAANTTTCRHLLGILVFSVGSVAGIIAGTFISNIQDTLSDKLMAVLQGLAGGTLLYVTLSEIIPRERARWHQEHQKRGAGLYQLSCIGLGFTMMTILAHYLDAD
ncbi:zinc transporter ZIP1 [Coccinella septempunctata]|uniref:zinc transporter ZIP1 n=1 Tax=Coccinella septempunctata TaxID=41139 RepID=UPI001D097F05|nr:zinc transporter ZIP1 [Coccinella septempunctata]